MTLRHRPREPRAPVTDRETANAQLAAAIAAYDGPITVVPGFVSIVPKSKTSWIDPDTVPPPRAAAVERGPWMTARRREVCEERKARNAAARSAK